MTRRELLGSAGLVVTVAAAALGAACGGDNGTGPVPCDTYTGGIVSGTLPGTYDLVAYREGEKPSLVPPAATGTVTLTESDFTAAITIQGQSNALGGTYTTNGQAINVTLSGGAAQFTGTFRLRNDTLAVSGAVGALRLSLVGKRTTP